MATYTTLFTSSGSGSKVIINKLINWYKYIINTCRSRLSTGLLQGSTSLKDCIQMTWSQSVRNTAACELRLHQANSVQTPRASGAAITKSISRPLLFFLCQQELRRTRTRLSTTTVAYYAYTRMSLVANNARDSIRLFSRVHLIMCLFAFVIVICA